MQPSKAARFSPIRGGAGRVGPGLSTRAVAAASGLSTTPGNGGGLGAVGIVLQAVHDN